MRSVPCSAVYYGCDVVCKLKRCEKVIGLTDRRLKRITGVPCAETLLVSVIGTGKDACFFTELDARRHAQTQRFAAQDARLEAMQKSLNTLLSERMGGLNTTVGQRLAEVEKQFRDFREQSAAAQELLRKTMEERMTAMQTSNNEKLEQMRATVDEKLQKTLDERISQSFKMVNERLAGVYKGLGEMQTLAGDVGDLKKVMAGVKTRGILGEIQLGAIITELLSPEQYEENAVTRPGTANRVEFAIKLPGEGDIPVYLPIDAKFPADAYHHLVDAYEAGDPDAIKARAHTIRASIATTNSDYDREKLHNGNVIQGPAIIEQMDSTTIVLSNQKATVDAFLNMMIERK